ncbi:hypothetical protein LSTR_LSTR008773 [Laodelphax striatellus]|uniref:Uncharacterized protein n=1 Tax=Laodelphax striatellus TaxID=195883 RepID=A0A482XR81_LAOST|nr:hypothetical protein LSTR_LSTR008773 [Laodelphax striatellus]
MYYDMQLLDFSTRCKGLTTKRCCYILQASTQEKLKGSRTEQVKRIRWLRYYKKHLQAEERRKDQEGGDTDSEEETEKLLELEEALRLHDPLWQAGGGGSGGGGDGPPPTSKEAYQLHVATERLRAVEALFQPQMLGCGQAGLAETVQYVLNGYDAETAQRLAEKQTFRSFRRNYFNYNAAVGGNHLEIVLLMLLSDNDTMQFSQRLTKAEAKRAAIFVFNFA